MRQVCFVFYSRCGRLVLPDLALLSHITTSIVNLLVQGKCQSRVGSWCVSSQMNIIVGAFAGLTLS